MAGVIAGEPQSSGMPAASIVVPRRVDAGLPSPPPVAPSVPLRLWLVPVRGPAAALPYVGLGSRSTVSSRLSRACRSRTVSVTGLDAGMVCSVVFNAPANANSGGGRHLVDRLVRVGHRSPCHHAHPTELEYHEHTPCL